MKQRSCIINARKFDRKIYRSWTADLIEETPDYWLFIGVFDKQVTHNDLGVIRRGTVSYEYYWKDKWFNVFRFHEPEGRLRNYYCNINQPPIFEKNVLDYVDLDIDLLVQRDLTYRILDQNEFEINAQLLNYTSTIVKNVENSLAELTKLVKLRQFPFDFVK